MARIPDEVIERLKKEVDLAELVTRSGVALKHDRHGPGGPLPVPRRRHPSLVVTPGQGPVALPGGLPGRRVGHRLGDARRGGELPPRRRAAAGRRPGRSSGPGGHGASTSTRPPPARPGRRRRRRPRAARPGRRLLPRRPCSTRPRPSPTSPGAGSTTRGDRRLPLGYANRTLGLRLPDQADQGRGGAIRGRLSASASTAPRATSTWPARWWSRSSTPPAASPSSTGARSADRPAPGHARPPLPARPAPRASGTRRALAGGEVIVCESLIDALSCGAAGFSNVTAAYGTAGFTDDHTTRPSRATGSPASSSPTTTTRPATRRRRGPGHELMASGDRVLPGRAPAGATSTTWPSAAEDPARRAGPSWCARPAGWARAPGARRQRPRSVASAARHPPRTRRQRRPPSDLELARHAAGAAELDPRLSPRRLAPPPARLASPVPEPRACRRPRHPRRAGDRDGRAALAGAPHPGAPDAGRCG